MPKIPESNEALAELILTNPRVFWGRVVKAFLKSGWNPPDPSESITEAILDAIGLIEEYGTGLQPTKLGGTNEGYLVPRELQVVSLLADGFTNDEIAKKLGIAIQTVKFHRGNALKKIGARNTPHAISILFRRGELV